MLKGMLRVENLLIKAFVFLKVLALTLGPCLHF